MEVELEFHQLNLKYADLRIVEGAQQSRLAASLLGVGQKNPVLVVEAADEFVLIDGYRRVAAIRELGRDTVRSVVLPLCEVDALVLAHGLQRVSRRSMLEEAWLLRELNESHGLSQSELASRFERSVSWVCRRLGLVRDLPEGVEQLVRSGSVGGHAASKFLLPLARAKPDHAEKLASNLQGAHLTSRQVGRLYSAWRSGTAAQKREIVAHPLLHLKALEELEKVLPAPPEDLHEQRFERELSLLARACWRAHQVYRESLAQQDCLSKGSPLLATWRGAQKAFHALEETLSAVLESAQSPSPS